MPDIGKGRKRSKKITYNVQVCPDGSHNLNSDGTPQHAAARAAVAEAKPSTTKATTGNPVSGPDHATMRHSAPITQGHAADSAGNAGNPIINSRELAYQHPDLRQSSTTTVPFANVTANGPAFVGQVAFGGMDGPTKVNLTILEAANEAGSYRGMQRFDDRPNNAQAAGHPSRNSATAPNGSHSTTGSVTSSPRPAMKGSDALAIMKEAMRANGR